MTIGSHQSSIGKSQTHLTPPFIIKALGPFDLDPCAAIGQPWRTAARQFTIEDDGLSKPWIGRVWLNPPFDRRQVAKWVDRLAQHDDGILLVHARTETEWFAPVWGGADSILFMSERVHFHLIDGTRQRANSGAPVVLAAFGAHNTARLIQSALPGRLVTGWRSLGFGKSLREMEAIHDA